MCLLLLCGVERQVGHLLSLPTSPAADMPCRATAVAGLPLCVADSHTVELVGASFLPSASSKQPMPAGGCPAAHHPCTRRHQTLPCQLLLLTAAWLLLAVLAVGGVRLRPVGGAAPGEPGEAGAAGHGGPPRHRSNHRSSRACDGRNCRPHRGEIRGDRGLREPHWVDGGGDAADPAQAHGAYAAAGGWGGRGSLQLQVITSVSGPLVRQGWCGGVLGVSLQGRCVDGALLPPALGAAPRERESPATPPPPD